MDPEHLPTVRSLMEGFAADTGLTGGLAPRRYLWTDAFAVCNYLGLYESTGDERWRGLALGLVDQVHRVLGRHREDDPRDGWLGGRSDEEAARHPTAAGLRIGKEAPERGPSEPVDPRREWDRDGQYFHYLTKWMHALQRVCDVVGDPTYNRWGRELALTAWRRFRFGPEGGPLRGIRWKMSIDLTRPLVDAMGQHDPLDGLVTFARLRAGAGGAVDPELNAAIHQLQVLCGAMSWSTDDPLGLGGLLTDAYNLTRLIDRDGLEDPVPLLTEVLEGALAGLERYRRQGELRLPSEYRLAFRELGLAIGLSAGERLESLPEPPGELESWDDRVHALTAYLPLREYIRSFWLDPRARASETWTAHADINTVMLATSLAPGGFLGRRLEPEHAT